MNLSQLNFKGLDGELLVITTNAIPAREPSAIVKILEDPIPGTGNRVKEAATNGVKVNPNVEGSNGTMVTSINVNQVILEKAKMKWMPPT